MFEANYRITSRTGDEVMEFETFKAAYKRLMWLRRNEGTTTWPYAIKNLRTGKTHTYVTEAKRKNLLHLSAMHRRGVILFEAVFDAYFNHMGNDTYRKIWDFAYNMSEVNGQ